MLKQGLLEDRARGQHRSRTPIPKQQRSATRGESSCLESNSATTIYQNALQEVNQANQSMHAPEQMEGETEYVAVDSEVNFTIKRNRESSSSDDQVIDTSDERLDKVDCDKFISDCQEEARRLSGSHAGYGNQEQNRSPGKVYQGEQLIHNAEDG